MEGFINMLGSVEISTEEFARFLGGVDGCFEFGHGKRMTKSE
jgi:hypothetical protein